MLELIYTSVPQGLLPGRSGFSTVAITAGMPSNLIVPLENLSGYNFTYQDNQLPPELNPVCCYYVKFRYGNQLLPVAGRIAPNGLDYSKRNNKIAHNINLESASELNFAGGAAELFVPAGFIDKNSTKVCGGVFVHDFQRPPCELDARRLPSGTIPEDLTASTWQKYTNSAATAAFAAYRFREAPQQPLYVKFDRNTPVEDLLELTAEVCRLLEPHEKSDFTFNTYFHSASAATECFLRFIPDFSQHLGNLRRFHSDSLIELGTVFPEERLQQYADRELTELAITGHIKQAEVVDTAKNTQIKQASIPAVIPVILNQAAANDIDAPLPPPQPNAELPPPEKYSAPGSRAGFAMPEFAPQPDNRRPLALIGLLVCVILLMLAIVWCFLPAPQAAGTAAERPDSPEKAEQPAATAAPEQAPGNDQVSGTNRPVGNTIASAAKTGQKDNLPPPETHSTAPEPANRPEQPGNTDASDSATTPATPPTVQHSAPDRIEKGRVKIHSDGRLEYRLSDDEKKHLKQERLQIVIGQLSVEDFNKIILPLASYKNQTNVVERTEAKKNIVKLLGAITPELGQEVNTRSKELLNNTQQLAEAIERYVEHIRR